MARLRTFIAVEIGKAIRDRAVALQDELARVASEVKWVEPENLHITLLFLGEVNDRDLPDICRSVSDTCGGMEPFPMSIETVGCFPNPRRPRTLWVGVGTGTQELVALHDALEPPLLELGCYRREDRPYTPHLTLGRVKADRPNDKLTAALGKHAGWQGGQTAVREVLVMSSELTPQGPIYTVLGRGKLGGEGA
jgi:2'-5' RNA ligase